jgi:hypothetical protein
MEPITFEQIRAEMKVQVLTAAIGAVLDLHTEQEITLPNGDWGSHCITCNGYEYPCRTVLAIKMEFI